MIQVFASLLLVNLDWVDGGGRVVEGVQVGEDDGEGGALPRVHLNTLLQRPVGVEDVVVVGLIGIAGNNKVNTIVMFGPDIVNSLNNVVNGLLLKAGPRWDVN